LLKARKKRKQIKKVPKWKLKVLTKKEPKPYKKVIDSTAVTQRGLIDVHKVDNKYLFEIPDSI
jgi:hypothetical protein